MDSSTRGGHGAEGTRRTTSQILAIKIPRRSEDLDIILHEARILSHLSKLRGYTDVIVPFHGYDLQSQAVVLTAVTYNLEDYISVDLESVSLSQRTSIMARVFWNTARCLVKGLAWLHEADVVHGDIKPANILLQAANPIMPGERLIDNQGSLISLFKPVIADFTSAVYLGDHSSGSSSSNTISGLNPSSINISTNIGGGTYDYLAPEYLASTPPAPGPWMDVYALAVTLLVLLTGRSPFAAAQNRYQLLSMVKEGRPIDFARMDVIGNSRLMAVQASLRDLDRLDPLPAIEAGLKRPTLRVEARNWVTFFDPDRVKMGE